MNRKPALYLILIALCAAAVACGGSDEPQDDPTDGAKEITEAGDPVPPGRYTYGDFEVPFSLEVPDGWSVGDTFAEFFYVHQGEDAYLALAHPDYILNPDWDQVQVAQLTPQKAIDLLVKRAPRGESAEPQDVAGERAPTAEFAMSQPFALFGGKLGEFNNPLAGNFRVSAVQAGEELVLVMQIASDPEGWTETAPLAASVEL